MSWQGRRGRAGRGAVDLRGGGQPWFVVRARGGRRAVASTEAGRKVRERDLAGILELAEPGLGVTKRGRSGRALLLGGLRGWGGYHQVVGQRF